MAALQGVDLDGSQKNKEVSGAGDKVTMFGDPADYVNLSTEEQQQLTDKMMNNHRSFVGNNPMTGRQIKKVDNG